jgi:hypothetical protein
MRNISIFTILFLLLIGILTYLLLNKNLIIVLQFFLINAIIIIINWRTKIKAKKTSLGLYRNYKSFITNLWDF